MTRPLDPGLVASLNAALPTCIGVCLAVRVTASFDACTDCDGSARIPAATAVTGRSQRAADARRMGGGGTSAGGRAGSGREDALGWKGRRDGVGRVWVGRVGAQSPPRSPARTFHQSLKVVDITLAIVTGAASRAQERCRLDTIVSSGREKSSGTKTSEHTPIQSGLRELPSAKPNSLKYVP